MGTPASGGDVGGQPRPRVWRNLSGFLSLHLSTSHKHSVPRAPGGRAPSPHTEASVPEAEGKKDTGPEVRWVDSASLLSEGLGKGGECGNSCSRMCWNVPDSQFSGYSSGHLPLAFHEQRSPTGGISFQWLGTMPNFSLLSPASAQSRRCSSEGC